MRVFAFVETVLVPVLALGALVGVLSCGAREKADTERAERAAEGILEGATGKKTEVEIDGKDVRIEGKDYKVNLDETTSWPETMFPEVPKLGPGRIERVSKSESAEMSSFNIYLQDLSAGDVEAYVGQLRQAGWEVSLTSMGEKGSLAAGQKGQLGLNFAFNAEDKSGVLAVFSTSEP